MCGIVGIASRILTSDDKKAFRQLLFIDTVRGEHSTGLLGVKNGEGTMFKKALPGPDFLELRTTEKVITQSNEILLGHNRHATVGAVTQENSHPFVHEHIVGVHNGTLKTRSQLPDNTDFIVDSDNIMYAISKLGIEETYPKLNGAVALVWFDTKEKSINFIRNDERPLFYGLTKDRETFMWASEPAMIRFAAARNKLDIDQVMTFNTHMWYSFTIPSKAKEEISLSRKTLNPFRAAPLPVTVKNKTADKEKEPAQKRTVLHRINTFHGQVGQNIDFYVDSYETTTQGHDVITGFKFNSKDRIVRGLDIRVSLGNFNSALIEKIKNSPNDLHHVQGEIQSVRHISDETLVMILPQSLEYKGPEEVKEVFQKEKTNEKKLLPYFNTQLVNEAAWMDLTKNGCAYCTDPVVPEQAEDIIWLTEDDFVCCERCEDSIKMAGVLGYGY